MFPIITYHAIGDQPSPLFTPPSLFEAQLTALASAGYKTISLAEMVSYLKDGAPLPHKCIVLTFDDGYLSVYSEAWPRLMAFGYTATVLLVTDYIGRDNQWPGQLSSVPVKPLMDWSQVAKMADQGCEFAPHTRTHQPLPLLEAAEIEAELIESQAAVQTHTGQTARIFAQPYGASNDQVDQIVRRHFDGAVSTRLGVVQQDDDLFDLARIDAFYWSPKLIPHMHKPLFRHYLRFRQTLRNLRRRYQADWQSDNIDVSDQQNRG